MPLNPGMARASIASSDSTRKRYFRSYVAVEISSMRSVSGDTRQNLWNTITGSWSAQSVIRIIDSEISGIVGVGPQSFLNRFFIIRGRVSGFPTDIRHDISGAGSVHIFLRALTMLDPERFTILVPLFTRNDLKPCTQRISGGDFSPVLIRKPITAISLSVLIWKPVWLMKCPPNVTKYLQTSTADMDGGAAAVEGHVTKVILVLDLISSSNLLKVIDNDKGAHMRPIPGMIGLVACGPRAKKKLATKGSDTERTRSDHGLMEGVMFKLFEWQPDWTLRQVIQETDEHEAKKTLATKGSDTERTRRDHGKMEGVMFKLFEWQPDWTLRQVIQETDEHESRELADQGTYELKPEYRKSTEDPASLACY